MPKQGRYNGEQAHFVFKRGVVDQQVVNRKSAHNLIVEPDGNADERNAFLAQIARARAVKKQWLFRYIRYVHGTPGFDDASGDALAANVAATAGLCGFEAVGSLNAYLAAVGRDERDGAAHHVQVFCHELERLV